MKAPVRSFVELDMTLYLSAVIRWPMIWSFDTVVDILVDTVVARVVATASFYSISRREALSC